LLTALSRRKGNTVTTNEKKHILIVDDEEGIRTVLAVILEQAGYRTTAVPTAEDALSFLEQGSVDLVVTDLALGSGMDGLQLLREIRRKYDAPVVLITAFGTVKVAVEAMREGAYDFIRKPLRMEDILAVVKGALHHYALSAKGTLVQPGEIATHCGGVLIGESSVMHDVYRLVNNVSKLTIPVLIQGEPGSGKSAVARAIHELSPYAEGPFEELDCARTPTAEQVRALFGGDGEPGLVGRAAGGTLMIENIDAADRRLQDRLFAYVRARYSRVRTGIMREAEVQRVMAGSRIPLHRLVEVGRFSESLYSTLSIIVIELPPLRRRPEDIPLLVSWFLARYGAADNPIRMEERALECLCRYSWPENVRELEATIRDAGQRAENGIVRVQDLPEHIRASAGPVAPVPEEEEPGLPGAMARKFLRESKQRLAEALRKNRKKDG